MNNEEMFRMLLNEMKSMNEEMKNMKEEMTGIKQETKNMKEEMTGIKQETKNMKEEMTGIKQETKNMKEEMTDSKQDMNNRFDKVEAQLHRMEESQQQDVVGTLKLMDKRLNNIVYDLDYINKQAADQNLIINRLQKQIES